MKPNLKRKKNILLLPTWLFLCTFYYYNSYEWFRTSKIFKLICNSLNCELFFQIESSLVSFLFTFLIICRASHKVLNAPVVEEPVTAYRLPAILIQIRFLVKSDIRCRLSTLFFASVQMKWDSTQTGPHLWAKWWVAVPMTSQWGRCPEGSFNPFCKNLILFDFWLFRYQKSHPVSVWIGFPSTNLLFPDQ